MVKGTGKSSKRKKTKRSPPPEKKKDVGDKLLVIAEKIAKVVDVLRKTKALSKGATAAGFPRVAKGLKFFGLGKKKKRVVKRRVVRKRLAR